MSDFVATRCVENNPLPIDGSGGVAPQQLHAVTRTGRQETFTWGDSASRTIVKHSNDDKLKHQRLIYHPGFDVALQYPDNPTRTINYYHSGMRKYDIQISKTLQSSVNTLDLQRWEDVVITEVWQGGGDRMSMLAKFFETLHLFRVTPPPTGSYVAWVPFDLNYDRHLIQPIALTLGNVDIDVREIYEALNTGLGAYVDLTVQFSFKLIRPTPRVGSLIKAEGL